MEFQQFVGQNNPHFLVTLCKMIHSYNYITITIGFVNFLLSCIAPNLFSTILTLSQWYIGDIGKLRTIFITSMLFCNNLTEYLYCPHTNLFVKMNLKSTQSNKWFRLRIQAKVEVNRYSGKWFRIW